MKPINKMSRLTGELEKAFNILNAELFDNSLPAPIITVQSTPRAYGHYTTCDVWSLTNGEGKREINLGAGTLDRPIENILATLLHEMVHEYNDLILHEQDTSNRGVYHNSVFRREAEAHGLTVERSEKYGWTITSPGDRLLDLILTHDELREIEICRSEPSVAVSIGGHAGNSNSTGRTGTNPNAHYHKYRCPCCKNSVRSTKIVNIACLDCGEQMIEV